MCSHLSPHLLFICLDSHFFSNSHQCTNGRRDSRGFSFNRLKTHNMIDWSTFGIFSMLLLHLRPRCKLCRMYLVLNMPNFENSKNTMKLIDCLSFVKTHSFTRSCRRHMPDAVPTRDVNRQRSWFVSKPHCACNDTVFIWRSRFVLHPICMFPRLLDLSWNSWRNVRNAFASVTEGLGGTIMAPSINASPKKQHAERTPFCWQIVSS